MIKHLRTPDGGGVVDLGQKREALHKWDAEPPPFTGRHLWVVVSCWHVAEPAREQYILDVENLVTLAGPACFWCEAPWSPTIGTRCFGDPDSTGARSHKNTRG